MSKFTNFKSDFFFYRIVRILTICFVSAYLFFLGFAVFFTDTFVILYYEHWYPLVRLAGSTIVNFIPFPIIYFIIAVIIAWLVYSLFLLIKRRLLKSLTSLFIGLTLLFTSFYVFWGFNYRIPSFVERLSLQVNEPNADWIESQIRKQALVLDSLRTTLQIPTEIDYTHLHINVEQAIDDYLTQLNQTKKLRLPYKLHNDIKIQPLFSGALLRLETSGIYLSQTFQGHIDSGLSHIQIPNTLMHEMLHGYGVTEESDCNLIAYLAGNQSPDPWIRYSAEIAWFRYLAFDWIAQDREAYFEWRAKLPINISTDLDEINAHLRVYTPIMGPVKDKIYGAYLRSNGISDGIANYSYFVKVIYSLENGPTTH